MVVELGEVETVATPKTFTNFRQITCLIKGGILALFNIWNFILISSYLILNSIWYLAFYCKKQDSGKDSRKCFELKRTSYNT